MVLSLLGFRRKRAAQDAEKNSEQNSEHGTPTLVSSGYRSESSSQRAKKHESSVFTTELDRHAIMAHSIHTTAQNNKWLIHSASGTSPTVVLRVSGDDFTVYPPEAVRDDFVKAMQVIRPEVALRMSSDSIDAILSNCSPDVTVIPLKQHVRIQLFDSISQLVRARVHQSAAFIRDEKSLILWSDNVHQIIDHARQMESDLLEFIWAGGNSLVLEAEMQEKNERALRAGNFDLENNHPDSERPRVFVQPLIISGAMLLCMVFMGFEISDLLHEFFIDRVPYRFVLVIFLAFFFFAAMFFATNVVQSVIYSFGPISQAKHNSRYFSCIPPKRITENFPHITIQCPVYKESLNSVIDPTIRSLRKAMRTYELQGGTASIFMNDDGMQLIDEKSANLRREYYASNKIGWVARPPHQKGGFVRAGRFKKASNMNYCLNVSKNVELALSEVERHDRWTEDDEERAYVDCLGKYCENDTRTWAEGNIRIGDIILLIDCDTRVPEDYLLDAASEFYHCEDLAILQHTSSVMQVVHNYWENMITYFTEIVYHAIQMATASGDVAAFVGHNAFLRWTAMQEAASTDEKGFTKYWSESHVSEDFELSMKMHKLGYTIRFAVYAKGFMEGVSLSIYDEISRWQKYAYGCSELMFHPFVKWPTSGPLTPLFREFLTSTLPCFSKFSIISYVGTYFALGSVWILTIANYFLVGWLSPYLDKFYISSWQVLLSVLVVFAGAGSLSFVVVRYRVGAGSLLSNLLKCAQYVIPLSLFFNCLSFHISMSLLSHLFSYNVQWGSTAKELDDSNFFKEVPRIFRTYWVMYAIMILTLAGVAVLTTGVIPYHFQIHNFAALFPVVYLVACHTTVPFILNPQIMKFTY